MPTVSPVSRIPLPIAREHSYLASPRESDSVLRQGKRANETNGQLDSALKAVNNALRAMEKTRRRILGGAPQGVSGWHKPRNGKYEVDATFAYDGGTVIHIQPTSSLVTTGIRDAANPTGPLITSCAGFWVATQYVPSKTTVSGNDVWNLPQFPLPVATDLDDSSNYWLYLGEMTP